MHRLIPLLLLAISPALGTPVALFSAPGRLGAAETPETLPEKIDRLIQELGHEKYSVRERAQKELAELGFEAYDALSAAATHEDLEIATRAQYLLLLIPAQWSIENEPEEVRRYLAVYQSEPPEVKLAALARIAPLPGGTGVPALCRLVRFEESIEWSKHAAVVLLDWEPLDEAGRARWAKTVRETLGRSARPGAQWLHAYLQHRENPKATLTEWTSLVEEEHKLLQRSPDQSSPRIVAALFYYLAMAQAEQGDEAAAETTARQARELTPIQSLSRLLARVDMAAALQRRGRFRWAEMEYRRVLDATLTYPKVQAGQALAEMWHDQGNNLAAADVLKELLQVDHQELDEVLKPTRTVREVQARMNYFSACHWAGQGDRVKQRQFLDAAVQDDPAELDALIARYRLPDAEPEYHQQTVELIAKAASELRQAIAVAPDKAVTYNQFAWLIGNTEGDLDEALRYAKKAVELEPETGAYLDTLAHVYFGRGDLENAVKYQTEAAQFDPHSGLIAEKLEVFRNALKEHKEEQNQTDKTDKDEHTNQTHGEKDPAEPESSQPE